MKTKLKIITALVLTMLSFAASAQQRFPVDSCIELYELAAGVMEVRQAGYEIPAMIGMAGNDTVARAIVDDAITHDRWRSELHQRRVVLDFAEKYYRGCYAVWGDGPLTREALENRLMR